ncbi:hypothetical protein BT93_L2581 [Corymbia citriodora subsp. variegata]|uniref:Uncharacterized protein n=1 Tax=Corymbia citriodora subsp. variegata TaxID=360336 RepID=A0A8T0CJA7_CORYI|nr:hypothetical protein BT93_L2581 [Corymbia citriodora subsp. variegata]
MEGGARRRPAPAEGRSGRRAPEVVVPPAALRQAPGQGPDLGRHRADRGQPRAGPALRVAARPGQAHGPDRRLHRRHRRARSRRPAHRLGGRDSQCRPRARRALLEARHWHCSEGSS